MPDLLEMTITELDRIIMNLTWAHWMRTKPTVGEILDARTIATHLRKRLIEYARDEAAEGG